MVLYVDLDVNALARQGREYKWQKPTCCPICKRGLWWHGFVPVYLCCFVEAVFLRRLYCPSCKSVHRLRPRNYWPRYQSPIRSIREVIAHRIAHGRWRPDLPRPRQRQWWRRLGRMVNAVLGFAAAGSLLVGFDTLVARGIVAVGSVI